MQPEAAGGEVLQPRECVPAGQPVTAVPLMWLGRAERGSQSGTQGTTAEEGVWEGAGMD